MFAFMQNIHAPAKVGQASVNGSVRLNYLKSCIKECVCVCACISVKDRGVQLSCTLMHKASTYLD